MDKSGTSHVAEALETSRSGLARGFRLGAWRVSPEFCTLSDGARTEQLEPKVMAVLLCLAEHAAQVVTREQFIREVWKGRTVSDEVLSRSISLLRTCLGDDAHAPRFIQTVPRVGYALIIAVERIERPATNDSTAPVPKLPGEASPAPTVGTLIRVAVLPFANLSRDPDREFFADGLTDELISCLSRVEGLELVARTSAFRFKSRSADVREIGRLLGTAYLVDGSVRSDGQQLRITMQLIDVRTGYQVTGETYDRELRDVFAVQRDIAAAVVQSLAHKLPAGLASGPAAPTQNLEAYLLYLRGRQQLTRRGEAPIRSSIELFLAAAALDPEFASAHVALAYGYALLPTYAPVSIESMREHADAALAEVARHARHSPEAAGVRAVLEVRRMRWIAAEEAFREALAANPADSEAREWYSQLLGSVGKREAALREAQRALATDPLSPILHFRLAAAHLWNDQDSDAERHLAIARELGLEPTVTPEAYALLLARQGRFDELTRAFIDMQRGRRQSDEWVPAVVDAIRDRASVAATAELIENAYSTGQMGWTVYIGTLVLTGHPERALRAFPSRPNSSTNDFEFLFAREARELRQHADFPRLIAELGIDEYWDRYGWPPGIRRTAGSIECV